MLNGQNTVIEFWDSKLSGKKKIALNSKIIYFNKFEGDVIFGLKFACGYINYEIKQLGEDKYNLYINGNRFNDLMALEKYEKHNSKYQKQMEKQKQKKIEDDYYKRALKYNGNDYYEGKEQALLNNPKNNNKGYMQYDYDLYKKRRSNTLNNKANNYVNNNGYNNNYPNNNYPNNNYPNNNYPNYNYPNNNYPNYNYPNNNYPNNNYPNNNYPNNNYPNNNYNNNNNNNEQPNNPYPSFSQFLYNENNANNKNNTNSNNNYNYNAYDNTRENNYKYNNNNNNKNNNLMNQIEEVFSNEKNLNQNQNQNFNEKSTSYDLPTYSEICGPQNQNNNGNNKNSNENDNLINYIGNLNKDVKPSMKPQSQVNSKNNSNSNKNGYNFGFENDEGDYNINDSNNIELNIYNHENIDKERNKKKMFINKSSFKNPLNEEDYDMENPYNDY